MKTAKRPGESFSELALRTFRPASLRALVGLLDDEEAEALLADLSRARERDIAWSRRRGEQIGWPE